MESNYYLQFYCTILFILGPAEKKLIKIFHIFPNICFFLNKWNKAYNTTFGKYEWNILIFLKFLVTTLLIRMQSVRLCCSVNFSKQITIIVMDYRELKITMPIYF